MRHSIIAGLISLYLTLNACEAISLWPSDLVCEYRECCRSPWIKHDFDLLAKNLSSDLFGQHLVAKSAFKKIRAHIENVNSKKPLVLSLHGAVGTGKSFFAKLIVESFYKLGTNSKHVVFLKTQMLYKIEKDSPEQGARFREVIESTVARCELSMFIIEDAQLMNPKLLDVLLPYVNYAPIRDGVNYNRAIFIFISNSGSETINNYVLEQFRVGREREWITFEEMQKIIHDEVLGEEKPFKNSAFVEREVVDAYIPFLPLEREHVKECVYAILKKRKLSLSMTVDILDKVLNSIQYFPEGVKVFSKFGCKRLEKAFIGEYI